MAAFAASRSRVRSASGISVTIVMPFDLIPDFFAGIGYSDDAAVLALAIGMVAREIKPEHRAKARAALEISEPVQA